LPIVSRDSVESQIENTEIVGEEKYCKKEADKSCIAGADKMGNIDYDKEADDSGYEQIWNEKYNWSKA
jgi:hypothetical protein